MIWRRGFRSREATKSWYRAPTVPTIVRLFFSRPCPSRDDAHTSGNTILTESRRLEVRCGLKSKDQQRKVYVHMLNGTMCATERALCCLVENYQTPDVRYSHLPACRVIDHNAVRQGLVIPQVLRPYMQGRDFLPWKKALPKNLQRKQV